MDCNELWETYRIDEPYTDWFLDERVFKADLKYDGWKLLEAKMLNEIHSEFNDSQAVLTNPNFYQDGYTLAESRRSKIMASGLTTSFTYDGEEFTSFFQLFKKHGAKVIGLLQDIEWNETKDWIIVDKKSNKLLAQFDYWGDSPTRKDVE
tara:strand:+ start:12497 stop:12946 length:450 start_codon:yes stop_codon:yes gene_type:complete